MELKEFVERTVAEIVAAVDSASDAAARKITLTSNEGSRTIEFDVAVSAEEKTSLEGTGEIGGGIKVLAFAKAEGAIKNETVNGTVSRVRFGVHVSSVTKSEAVMSRQQLGVIRPNRPRFN